LASLTTLPTVKRGDTWSFIFTWKSCFAPIDLSECSARMQVRNQRTKELVASIDSSTDITIDGPNGIVNARFPAEMTANIEEGSYLTDVELTFNNSTVISSQTVRLIVEEDVTV
jgi:hypothetical protein